AFDPARGAHLTQHLGPVERDRSLRVGVELTPLPALEVGEEAEPALVDAAQEHQPYRGMTVRRAGGDDHRVGLELVVLDRVVVPAGELHERIGIHVGFVQRTRFDGHGKEATARVILRACRFTTSPWRHATSTRPAGSTPRRWASSWSRWRPPPRSSRRAGPATCSSTPATASCSRCGTCTTTPSPTSIPRSAAASACPPG